MAMKSSGKVLLGEARALNSEGKEKNRYDPQWKSAEMHSRGVALK